MGRQSRGVRGIEVRRESGDDDDVVSMAVVSPESTETLLTACEMGYGKRTPLDEYRTQNRGGMGLITIKTGDRNGEVVNLRPVADDDHLMLITSGGKIIRIAVDSISVMSRNTMGVRLVRLGDDERVVAVERLAEKDTPAELSEPPPPTVVPPPADDESQPEETLPDESET